MQTWAEDVTEIRKGIYKRAERYDALVGPLKLKEEEKSKSRRSFPHSTPKCNPEGLLEAQIKERIQTQAGISSKFKKRHLKELPPSTR